MAEAQPSGYASATSADQFPCSECGAKLRFKPGSDMVKCDHCGHENAIAKGAGPWDHAAAVEEQDLEKGLAQIQSTAVTEEKRTVKCNA